MATEQHDTLNLSSATLAIRTVDSLDELRSVAQLLDALTSSAIKIEPAALCPVRDAIERLLDHAYKPAHELYERLTAERRRPAAA